MELTEKQKKVLAFYQDKKNWRPPTLKMMREFLKVSSDQTVLNHLDALRRKGYL